MTTPASTGQPTQFGNLAANLQFIDDAGVLAAPSDVLEIGSGMGTMLHHLRERGHRAVGVELRQEFIERSRTYYGALPIEHVQGIELPFPDQSFDVVVSFDVFEHIPDSDGHLRECGVCYAPAGRILIQTPNKWTNVVFETIRWRSFTRFREDHCSLHSLQELITRLEQHGFTRTRAFPIPVVNEFFRAKVRRHLGWPGLAALWGRGPDRLPLRLRTNLYVQAVKESEP